MELLKTERSEMFHVRFLCFVLSLSLGRKTQGTSCLRGKDCFLLLSLPWSRSTPKYRGKMRHLDVDPECLKQGEITPGSKAEESSTVRQRGGAPGASFMLTAPSRWRHSQQTASWGSTPAEGGVIVTGKWRWLSVISEATEKFCLGYWGCSRGKNAEHGCGM